MTQVHPGMPSMRRKGAVSRDGEIFVDGGDHSCRAQYAEITSGPEVGQGSGALLADGNGSCSWDTLIEATSRKGR